MNKIRVRERSAIIQSLGAGVVPRVGQHLIQVGRLREVEALIKDIELCAEGGSAFRLVIGEYGCGKTFFLNLTRSIAQERRMVTAHADLSPERRLHSSGGETRALYSELMQNIATRANPEGKAMSSVVERFVSTALQEAQESGTKPESVIRTRLRSLSEMAGGYDFAEVVGAYWRGHDTGNENLKNDAVRWLRAEFSTRTDSRAALGVRTIIDDANFYDHLKLMGRFVRLAGFQGLFVMLDEMVNLYKLANTQSRNANYEEILRILNDCLQGSAPGLGFVMGGTPEFLMDTRRGLYSYQALQSRLAENTFAAHGLVDYNSPVIRLSNLTQEELYLLLGKIRDVFAYGDVTQYLIPDEGMKQFMDYCAKRIGAAYFRTPRTTIKEFTNLLSVLEQNPHASWQQLVAGVSPEKDIDPHLAGAAVDAAGPACLESSSGGPAPGSDELSSFRL
jgi:bacteriophage exclusion system BrxC/D-like protein